LAPSARHVLRKSLVPARHRAEAERGVAWSTRLDDSIHGALALTGRLHRAARTPEAPLAIVVHGLGGSIESHYVLSIACVLERRGFDVLRVNLRGACRSAGDYYHAGLVADLEAVLASSEVFGRERIVLVGFSLGGHLVSRFASLSPPPSVRAVAAVCPPLDLALGADAIDAPARRPYLRYVLSGMCEIYEAVAARADVPIPVSEARAIRSLREWDERIIAPRFGFRDADHYYREVSVGPRLGAIEIPTLLVVGDRDPMIPLEVVRPSLDGASRSVDARIVPGGHVGFPRGLDLGERASRGIDDQVAAWLERRAAM
jgi:hypothetical protein